MVGVKLGKEVGSGKENSASLCKRRSWTKEKLRGTRSRDVRHYVLFWRSWVSDTESVLRLEKAG